MQSLINKDRVVDLFLRYGAINSPRGKESVLAKVVEDDLRALGFDIVYDRAGEALGGDCSNMIASRKGTVTGTPIALSAHFDTIFSTENWSYTIVDGEITAGGDTVLGADDKAGLAAIIEAVRVADEQNMDCADLQLVMSVQEEAGLLGALHMDLDLLTSKFIYVFDVGEPVGRVYRAAPYHTEFAATFTGKGSHAGMCPENGINAIACASSAICRMKLGRLDFETTANVGIISGGNAINGIPEVCKVRGESRSIENCKLQEQLEHMRECCKLAAEEYGAQMDWEIHKWNDGYKLDEDSEIVELAKAAQAWAGLPVETGMTGGGSDASIFNSKGLCSLPIGIGYKNAHSVRESINVTDLVTTASVALGLLACAAARQ